MSLPLGTLVNTVTNLAFDLAGEIVASLAYVQNNAVDYDPATGGNASATPIVGVTVSAIVGKYSIKETDGQRIRFGDEKLIIKASELGAIVPNVDDAIFVVGSNIVPSGQTYGGGTYTLAGLTVGSVYFWTPDDNGGSEIQNSDDETIISDAGFFVAPETSLTLMGESSDTVSVTVQPLTTKRQIISIDLDPTGTIYTLQTRKASA